jgi:hypothetical protein
VLPPQGAVVSPLLANVYLHYVFDLWVEAWRKKVARGDVIVVRYDDDLVAGFQNRADAERFLSDFRDRLITFGLELHPDKTHLIEFRRFAVRNRKQRGVGKPETFTFLGFTHFCGNLTSCGAFNVWRITAKKRMVAKLKTIKAELQPRKHHRTSLLSGALGGMGLCSANSCRLAWLKSTLIKFRISVRLARASGRVRSHSSTSIALIPLRLVDPHLDTIHFLK